MNGAARLAAAAVMLISGCTSDTDSRAQSLAIDSAFSPHSRPLSPAAVNAYVARELGFTSRGGKMRCAYVPLGQANDRIYINTACLELAQSGDSLIEGSGRSGPVALRVQRDHDTVAIAGHEIPEDGGGYSASVRRIFPPAIAARILAGEIPDTLRRHLRAAAMNTGAKNLP